MWSDFTGSGGGSSAADYSNGDTSSPVSATALKIGNDFVNAASYSEPCATMKASEDYKLNGESCSTAAKFVCTKPCKYSLWDIL